MVFTYVYTPRAIAISDLPRAHMADRRYRCKWVSIRYAADRRRQAVSSESQGLGTLAWEHPILQ